MPLIAYIIPIMIFSVPLLAIVMHFRQKELELKLRASNNASLPNPAQQAEINALRSEMKEMKQMMQEQMIAVDTLLSNHARLLEGQHTSDLQNRISPAAAQPSEPITASGSNRD